MPGIFDFVLGIGNYEERCVGRHDADWGFVSTAQVPDGHQPYETAVQHTSYRDEGMVIVEAYDSRDEAEHGHARWVTVMTSDALPASLADCANAAICELGEAMGVEMKGVFPLRVPSTRR